jgi:hypothetical protein
MHGQGERLVEMFAVTVDRNLLFPPVLFRWGIDGGLL